MAKVLKNIIKLNRILYFLLLLVLLSCKTDPTIKSSDYKEKEVRIKILSEYFVLKSDPIDAVYNIYDVNINNRSIPGASDRDYKVILKIDKNDLNKWHEPENITSIPINYKWTESLISTVEGFELNGIYRQYTSKNKEMIIFEETGIILIRIVQH